MIKKINLLYLSRTSKLTGAENTLLSLLERLNKDIFNPLVVLPDNNGLFFQRLIEKKINIKIVKMAFLKISFNPVLIIWFFLNVLFLNFYFFIFLIRKRINIVICNSFQDSLFIAIPAKILRKKIVIYIKNILDKQWKKNMRAKFCKFFADKVIAVSEKAAEDISKYSFVKDKIKVIYDGIDCKDYFSRFKSTGMEKNYMTHANVKDSFKILNIGNLSELKGQQMLLQAVLTDDFQDINYSIFFLGDIYDKRDSGYKKKLQNIIENNKLNERIHLLGFKKEVRDYIALADIVVHCPIIDDAFPRVILESLCFGKIIVSTKVGGIPEMINDGLNGFLCDINEKSLAQKILYVYYNMDKLEFIKKNALKTVKEKFSLENHIKKTEEVYLSLVNNFK
jgi:glycosyltransferase involved in cell wall biosynthesis